MFFKKKSAEIISENGFEIRLAATDSEIKSALQLAEDVFMIFEAPEYPQRGIDSFKSFLWGRRIQDMISGGELLIWCCYKDGQLVGMMAMREKSHISLAFVHGDFHRQGIGRMLFTQAKKYALSQFKHRITVNASPYGIPFYHAMGFKETDMENVVDGIRSTPMAVKV